MALSVRRFTVVLAGAVLALAAAGIAGAVPGNSFVVTPLVSDNTSVVPAAAQDQQLVNSWGLGASPTSPWWVADNGPGLSTLYDGSGTKLGLTVTVGDAPTGLVFNGTTGFNLKGGSQAAFLFDSEAGEISAWNTSLGTTAEVEIPSSQGALFKGLAIAQTAAGPRLYATDFHNRRVDVFDGSWSPVNRPFQFFDPTIPRDYAPFGIQAIGNRVFVTYAKTTGGADEVDGPGLGFVDAFNATTGLLAGKVAIHGALNAPWGLAQAPAGFGRLGGDLLVGNFGDGHVDAYKPILGGLLYLPAVRFGGRAETPWRSTVSGRSSSATAAARARPARCSSPPVRTARTTVCSARSHRLELQRLNGNGSGATRAAPGSQVVTVMVAV